MDSHGKLYGFLNPEVARPRTEGAEETVKRLRSDPDAVSSEDHAVALAAVVASLLADAVAHQRAENPRMGVAEVHKRALIEAQAAAVELVPALARPGLTRAAIERREAIIAERKQLADDVVAIAKAAQDGGLSAQDAQRRGLGSAQYARYVQLGYELGALK